MNREELDRQSQQRISRLKSAAPALADALEALLTYCEAELNNPVFGQDRLRVAVAQAREALKQAGRG